MLNKCNKLYVSTDKLKTTY